MNIERINTTARLESDLLNIFCVYLDNQPPDGERELWAVREAVARIETLLELLPNELPDTVMSSADAHRRYVDRMRSWAEARSEEGVVPEELLSRVSTDSVWPSPQLVFYF